MHIPSPWWENESGGERAERVLEAPHLTRLELPHHGALRFGERAYALGMRLLARGRELGQDGAAGLHVPAPGGQGVPLEAIAQAGDGGAPRVQASRRIAQRQAVAPR